MKKFHIGIQFTKPISAEKYRNSKCYGNKIISQNLLKDSKKSDRNVFDGIRISPKFSRKLDGFTIVLLMKCHTAC